ncbi:MAG: hypothetical protein KIT16_07995 [Rhodospirillaceae bacterium]|nr:hypothetical protein [Rhodospirillaceae bacterium]
MRYRAVVWAAALHVAAAATSATAQTTDEDAARRAFMGALPVFQHPRCTNCHTRAEGPRQGDVRRAHALGVKRGPEGRGEIATQRCTTCHKAQNGAGGIVPGAPDWRMPPPGRAGWDGLTAAEICAALKDPVRNAGLTTDQLVEHLARDPLVAWAWAPGGRRAPPPVARDAFVAQMRAWQKAGGACPS